MRVLLTADPELPVPPRFYGGIERIVDILARHLQALGHHVGLLAHRDSTATVNRLYPWPGRRSQNHWDVCLNTFALWHTVRDFQPDVLHSFSRALYLLPLLRARLPKVMSYQRRPGRRQVKWAARTGGATLVFTGCSEHICEEGRAGGGSWHAIPNCTEVAKYTFRSSAPVDAPLVFLSRIERIKGAHTAIAIAKRASRRLLIAGNHGSHGEEGRYWENEIKPHLGKDGIEYVGTVDDAQKNGLLGCAVALLVPIEWDEPFGIVFVESLACGTPVISSPRGALPEIVRHGVDGFLVSSVDEGSASVAKLDTIDRQECRRRAEAAFSADSVVERYENLYRRLLSELTCGNTRVSGADA